MKKLSKIFRYIFISVFALVLVTVGIDAADNYDNFSGSLAGRIFLGEPEGPCPSDMVYVSFEDGDFCIDRYEASAGDDCQYLDPATQKQSMENLYLSECRAISAKGRNPWRNISRDQAIQACAKAGKRLATNHEWIQASQGTPDKDRDWGAEDCQVDNNWEAQPGMTGTAELCKSAFGAYDMIGNVWEWVSGNVDEGFFEGKELASAGFVDSTDGRGIPVLTNKEEPNQLYNKDYFWIKNTGLRGMVRGGYWSNGSNAGLYSLYAVMSPETAQAGVGFRCVK